MNEPVKTKIKDSILEVTIDRPKANAIDAKTFLFTSIRCQESISNNLFKAHSIKTGEIQQIHEYVYHLICEKLDERFSVCQN